MKLQRQLKLLRYLFHIINGLFELKSRIRENYIELRNCIANKKQGGKAVFSPRVRDRNGFSGRLSYVFYKSVSFFLDFFQYVHIRSYGIIPCSFLSRIMLRYGLG